MGEREIIRDAVLAQSLHRVYLSHFEFFVVSVTNCFELVGNAVLQHCLSQQHLRVGPIFSCLKALGEEREFGVRALDDLLVVDIAECLEVIVILSHLQSFLRVDHEDSLLVQSLQYKSFNEIRSQ